MTTTVFIDAHYLRTLSVTGALTFTTSEIEAAEAQYHGGGGLITTIERNGIALGFTHEPTGTVYLSAYAAGFWLGLMTITADGSAIFKTPGTSERYLRAIGTPLEEEARKITHLLSRAAVHAEGLYYRLGMGRIEDDFDAKCTAAGLGDATKKSLHLGKDALAVLSERGTLNGRVNAIITRYEAVMRNPGLLPQILETERIERDAYEMQHEKCAVITDAH